MNKISMKRTILLVIIISIGSAIGKWGVNTLFNSDSAASLDEQLVTACSELNKNCPINVDAETRLDNAMALPDKKIQYNYTLINYLKDDLDLSAIKETLKPDLVNGVKTRPDLELFRDKDVTMVFSYSDKNGSYLFNITVNPSDYK